MIFSFTVRRIKSTAAAMCSITCAADQRSGAGLKFHCASESPFVASSTFFFVDSKYCSALSFSACVTSCADAAAAPVIISKAISVPARDLVLIFTILLVVADSKAAGFLVFGWRNGGLQDTTPFAFRRAYAVSAKRRGCSAGKFFLGMQSHNANTYNLTISEELKQLTCATRRYARLTTC